MENVCGGGVGAGVDRAVRWNGCRLGATYSSTFVNEVRQIGESENSRVGVGVSNGLTRCKPSPFIRCGSACADSPR